MKKLSIVIPALNCQISLNRTLERLARTCHRDDVEIIVVDDGSSVPIEAEIPWWTPDDVKVARHAKNRGVGAAFDTGVKAASCDRLVLMGADVIPQYGWYAEVQRILDSRPYSITCAICSGFGPEKEMFRRGRTMRYGAIILPYHEHTYNGKKYSDILQAKWNYDAPEHWESGLSEITCILGAFYFTTKQVYNTLGGWMGHRKWGGLEPMLSIRAERSGVNLYVAENIEVAHEFGRSLSTPNAFNWALYNKMLMVHTMFAEGMRPLILDMLYKNGPHGYLNAATKQIISARVTGVIDDIREFHVQNWVKPLIDFYI